MKDNRHDFELLRDYTRHGDQGAFAVLVQAHLDLVYATAFRNLENQGTAQEVTQDVFAVLARKAWQFGPDDSVPAWLYKTTLLKCKSWLRGEIRRREREKTAVEMATTMKATDEQPALGALTPLLDEALLALSEKDRTVLLLRYYENQPFRQLGESPLGVSEDAARQRTGAALERLAGVFQRRGFRTATVAATRRCSKSALTY